MFDKLYAICLLVDNFEKSLGFYKEILGLEINSQDGRFANFKLGETSLAIFEKGDATSMFSKEHMNSGGSAVIGLQVDNVKDFCENLKSKDIKVFEGPKTTDWGQTVAYFKDPDGNIIEVSEPFEE